MRGRNVESTFFFGVSSKASIEDAFFACSRSHEFRANSNVD